jgi:hypothetical protein
VRTARRSAAFCLFFLVATVRPAAAQAERGAGATAPGQPPAAAHLAKAQEMRERLGLSSEYGAVPGLSALKVAVLDYGFEGIRSGRPYLPPGTVVVEHYDPAFVRRYRLGDPEYRKPFEPGNRHGRIMAQIVWAITGFHPDGPRFYLLNANGPTMLRRAVRLAIEERVDLVLFSGTFEGAGNGDGRGPINAIVSEAIDAGILWVNAAGNYGGRVYNGPVRVLSDGFLRLRDGSDVASLRFRNRLDENRVTITLTWNDYRDEEDAGTDKDLDLYVEDWAGRRIGAGDKVQVSGPVAPGSNETSNPRERVVLTNLAAGPEVANDPDYTYRIRIRARRGQFGPSDRIRVLLTAGRDLYEAPGDEAPRSAVAFLDASGEGEIYPPADHPLVLTVGDGSPVSSIGPTTDQRVKPDVIVSDSRAYFSDGEISAGSSNAAAYLAGVAAVLRAAEPAIRPRHLLQLARLGDWAPSPRPASTQAQRAAGRDRSSAATFARGTDPLSLVRSSTAARPPDPHPPSNMRVWRTPSRATLTRIVRGSR